jgi:hypothetical protein
MGKIEVKNLKTCYKNIQKELDAAIEQLQSS